MSLEGVVDHCGTDYIGGWVKPGTDSLAPIDIDIVYRGELIGHCFAIRTNTELSRFHFSVPMFFARGELKELTVWVRGSSQPLARISEDATASGPGSAGTFSRFGGTWVDRSDWQDQLAARRRAGSISAEVGDQIERFAVDGYVIIEGAVSEEIVDALNADIDDFWQDPPAGLLIETFEPDQKMHYVPPNVLFRDGATKLLDVYAFSENARKAMSPPRVTAFLSAIFEDKPKAFQGLSFWTGSQQPIHKDSAYVKVDTQPMHLAATWLALEEVVTGRGELEYYVGSHRSPDYLFLGAHKWMENSLEQHDDFLASLHRDADAYGYARSSFLAKKGDVLIWHADLAHGGAPIAELGKTRKSLVAHFTPIKDEPYYRRHAARRMLETETCAFVSSYYDMPIQ